ncbi:unnamed protein product [Mycena citricolor]|uniref:LysM domain-containing protein n=1 Tax=Mycena citricolor TaxID=2018698 RepID=A0AAD2JX21_9AGAR|nr:unnamed protein product [Mycena citricolor]CAK5280919.1 unnamed protein product [Mycena citricolor]
MSRWTDDDSDRLPDGMQRTGYDADTQRYYFRDTDGSVWQSPEGSEYGPLTRVSDGDNAYPPHDVDHDLESETRGPRRADGYQSLATGANGEHAFASSTAFPYRTLFPFFLIIGVVLLLVWRLILSPGLEPPLSPCVQYGRAATPYLVEPGDTCWQIAKTHSCSLEDLRKINTDVECEHLMPGTTLCVPVAHEPGQRRRGRR